MVIIFILYFGLISSSNSLECGVYSEMNTTELQQILNNCMYKTRISIEVVNKGNDFVNKSESMDYEGVDYDEDLNGFEEKETFNNKTSINSKRCTFHCVFEKLKIVDDEGFPDHEKISRDFIENLKNREIKDFFQDSVDECFQLTQQVEDLDTCDFSLNFFKCLGGKAKGNCADFPINSPFLEIL